MSCTSTSITVAAQLRALPLFSDVPTAELRRLAATTTRLEVEAGHTVINEDDLGGTLYIVLTGRLEVLAPGGATRLGWVGEQGIVGERGLLDGGRRCATVRAVRDSELLCIPGENLEALFLQHPLVLRRLSAIVAGRVHARPLARSSNASAITVIATGGTERWQLVELCDRLADALGEEGSTAVVGPEDGADTAALHQIEGQHRFVLYAASGWRSAWTRRCLRHADRVLLVGDASADPMSRTDEARLLATAVRPGVRVDLALLHASATPGLGTGRWFEGRSLDGWHHVTSDPGSLPRLARHLSGTATTLVLGGGGARGLAHLGVLKGLEDRGIPIDAVGGTSIGAIMGAFAALGWSDDARMRIATSSFIDTRRLVGYTLPVLSLSSSKQLTRLLRQHVGDTLIEDLPVPFFCVSANYSSGEAVIHDRGSLWRALRASISLPGVLPPVYSRGDLLVDGGVVNNLPVDVMRERHGGTVIAVDLRGRPRAHDIPEFEPTLSGWEVLARRLNPRRTSLRLPGPAATMLRAKELGGKEAHRRRRASADLLLEPPVDNVDSMDFRRAIPLAQTAYEYTLTKVCGGSPLASGAQAPL